jgi:3-oxoadipate enol-lactonase / 4-carboxymuconolactone decarboxylase
VTVDLHYVLEGPADAPVVALGPSLGMTLAMWDEQAAALAGRFRVLRFDHRGHGGSPVPPGPYTVEEMARDVVALLDRLGIERLRYCGLSVGGMVGMWLALDHPARVERLVLCCTSAHMGPPEMWTERAAIVREQGIDPLVEAALERWFTPDAPPAAVAKADAMLRSMDTEGYAGGCEALATHDLRGRLGAIRAPTLAVAGAGDPAAPPAHLEAIRDEIPGARLAIVEGARHLANLERPEELDRLLLDFLAPDGMRVRREVLGDARVDAAAARTTAFTAEFQDLITRYAWGEIWTRPGLDRRMRSAITITALVARGHENELAAHVRGACRNGLTADEIKEVLLQTAIYCGVPAANSAFAVAQRVLEEEENK